MGAFKRNGCKILYAYTINSHFTNFITSYHICIFILIFLPNIFGLNSLLNFILFFHIYLINSFFLLFTHNKDILYQHHQPGVFCIQRDLSPLVAEKSFKVCFLVNYFLFLFFCELSSHLNIVLLYNALLCFLYFFFNTYSCMIII